MYKKPLILVSIVVVILSAMVVTLQVQLQNSQRQTRTVQAQLDHAPKASARDMVKAACDVSRLTEKISEQTCGELQDYYKVEYLCSKTYIVNNQVTRDCWVEDNDQLGANW